MELAKLQDAILACKLAEQQRDALLAAIIPLLDGYIEWVQDAQMESGMGEVTQEHILSECEPAKNAAAVIADVLRGEGVFDQYAEADEYTFDKTVVPVRLAQHEGEKLVSRSQAKRLLLRFEKFKTVVLDFSAIEEIGQAFSDELFRVFKASHPGIEMIPVRMNAAVAAMIRRVMA